MSADNGMPESHEFGRWRFDAHTGDLFDGATTTRFEPQVAKLLDYFLRHQNTLISRDELMAAVWANRVVSDDAINRCISILRQSLSPDDKNAFIETVVRRGFVSHFPPPPAAPAPTVQPPRRRNHWKLAALAVVAAIVVYGAFRLFPALPPQAPDTDGGGIPVVAVLPFLSAGSADDSAFFANGMHDDLLTQLAQLQSLGDGFARAAVILLAVDGLVFGEAWRVTPFTSEQRARIVSELLRLTDEVCAPARTTAEVQS